jgi:hypothetical protein
MGTRAISLIEEWAIKRSGAIGGGTVKDGE